jgi:spore coat polysaccharide biosynthesis predicted glycosyltransferase SpsG
MGGSDTTGRTPVVVRAFDGFDLRVDVIVGPGFSAEQEAAIEIAAESIQADTRIVRDPDDLPKRMFQSDFAVTTASTTTYELLALGTPTICLPVVDNQLLIADALDERDAATVLDRNADDSTFRDAIRQYEHDTQLRRKRREAGRRLVDGRGASRVYGKILSFSDEKRSL